MTDISKLPMSLDGLLAELQARITRLDEMMASEPMDDLYVVRVGQGLYLGDTNDRQAKRLLPVDITKAARMEANKAAVIVAVLNRRAPTRPATKLPLERAAREDHARLYRSLHPNQEEHADG